MKQKILEALNLKIDSNQKWLLLSAGIGGLLTTYTSPTLMKEVVSSLPAEWLAFQNLAYSFAAFVIGLVWKGCVRENAMKYFLYLTIAETVCGIALGVYLLASWNVWIFAITSLIYGSLVSVFISKCIMAFKAKLWKNKDREDFDNNSTIIGGIVCISGFLLALVALPSLKTSILLWTIYCVVDDLGWMYVYFKNRQTLIQPDKEEKDDSDKSE